jgi:hypothetical protein
MVASAFWHQASFQHGNLALRPELVTPSHHPPLR